MLDALVAAERGEPSSADLRDGLGFFNWVRRMTVDAYYTSPIGIADIGFAGNRVLAAYETPREATEFVARRADELGPLNARRAGVSRPAKLPTRPARVALAPSETSNATRKGRAPSDRLKSP